MKLFLVHFLTSEGKRGREVFEALHVNELLKRFEKRTIVPLSIRQVPAILRFVIKAFSKKVTKVDMVELLTNLHIIVRSGIPLYQGLEDLIQEQDHPVIKSMLQDVSEQISTGVSLSKAFEIYQGYFGKVIINLIRIGEQTGTLETTLHKSAQFLKRSYELRRKVFSALIYPAVVVGIVFVTILVWFIFVLPMLAELFNQMDKTLPLLTQILMHISTWMQVYTQDLLIAVSGITLFVFVLYRQSKVFQQKFDLFMMQLPLVGKVIKFYNNAYITEYLQLALSSGTPLYNAIETVGNNIQNYHYQTSLKQIKNALLKGDQLSVALQNAQLFTPFTVRMLHIGEKSGKIEDQLQTVSEYYYEKVDDYAQNISKIIEPTLIIVMGGFFALIMVAMMGPIFDIVVEAM